MNPSDMDEGWLRNGQYAAIGTAVVAGGAAIALKGLAVAGISTYIINLAGNAALPYRVAVTGRVIASRFFVTATQYRAVVSRSVLAPLVSRLGWQWHHWAIPNSVGRAAGGGLNRLAQAGWNLFPIPARWNGYIGNGGFWYTVTGVGIGASPVAVPWGILEFGEWLFGDDVAETDLDE